MMLTMMLLHRYRSEACLHGLLVKSLYFVELLVASWCAVILSFGFLLFTTGERKEKENEKRKKDEG